MRHPRVLFRHVRRGLTPRGSGPVWVFHHIPKTGGSSVHRVLSRWFHLKRDLREREDRNEWPGRRKDRPPIDLTALRANDCISGHWDVPGQYIHERYPQLGTDPRYRLFSFVRDPLQLRLSLYFFHKKRGTDFGGRTMEQELMARPNYIARKLPCTAENYARVLSRYFFIGMTERLQDSLDQLAELVKRPRVPVPHVNRSRTDADNPELAPSFVREFREANQLDYLIFRTCMNVRFPGSVVSRPASRQ